MSRSSSDQREGPLPSLTGQAEPDDGTGSLQNEAVAAQTKRVEVLGAMAAGVAHEFNNLITIVLGSLEQLHRQALDARGEEQLQRAEWGVRQAGRLAGQMLSFVRRERREPEVVDLNAVLREFDKMLGHVAGEDVTLVLALAEQKLPVRLDPGQLELALLNLVRNAADAMSGSGRITLKTAVSPPDGVREPAVEVSVSDTGVGMSQDVARQAADAFFTTKQPGQGTGLGLWMVQRFVVVSQGKLEVESAVGRGTTVRLVLPKFDEAQPTQP